MREIRDALAREVHKAVVGNDDAIDALVSALAVGGHVLLEGVPGVAKTLLANSLARALGLSFRRLQFTPDMLPSDVTGTMTLRENALAFRPGPIFSQVVLADEVNRTPPKTQSALLEGMQERQVTVEGESHPLPEPFLVIATQNPIEYEGTYPLPEAQLDRFLFKIDIGYPPESDELAMLELPHRGVQPAAAPSIERVVSEEQLRSMRSMVDSTTVADEIKGYIVAVVRATRTLPSVALGASPRAAVHLLAASRAAARLEGRDFVTPDDVERVAPPVLRHRLILNPDAELERYRPDDAVRAALGSVPVPR